jgi:hypothetical protein
MPECCPAPGNRHTADNAIEFVEETLNLLSKSQTGSYARFDKGFAGEEFYSYWPGKESKLTMPGN